MKKKKPLTVRLLETADNMDDLDIDYSQSAPLHREAVMYIVKLEASLQRIANLPMTQRKGQPDPHLRARRIAVAALGGNPQKITKK